MIAVTVTRSTFEEAFKQATFDVNKAFHDAAGKDGALTKNESRRALDGICEVLDKLAEKLEEGT